MDESIVNDILENTRTQLTTYEERLQTINKKVKSGLKEINENFTIKLQDLRTRIIDSLKAKETSTNPRVETEKNKDISHNTTTEKENNNLETEKEINEK